jgi:hypothetical protein
MGRSAQKQLFVGKLDRELWASEKNELRDGVCWRVLGSLRAGLGFWADDAEYYPQQFPVSTASIRLSDIYPGLVGVSN